MEADGPRGEWGQAQPVLSPTSRPASALLSDAGSDSRQAAFSLPGRESCSPTEAHPPLPTSVCFSPTSPTHLAKGVERRREEGGAAEPSRWDHGPSLPDMPRTSFPAPGEATTETARSFRQCPGPHSLPQIQGPWGGAEGQTEVGGLPAPTPSTASLEPTSLRVPPALKIVLADASQVPLATSFWTGNSVRSLEGSRSGLPPHPHNSKLSSKEAGSPSCFSLGVLPPVPQGLRG